mgnify:CR=1 FL=1
MLKFRTNIDATIFGTSITGRPGRGSAIHCQFSVLAPEPLDDCDSRNAIRDAIWHLVEANYKHTAIQLAVALQEVRPNWEVEYVCNRKVDLHTDIYWREEDFS